MEYRLAQFEEIPSEEYELLLANLSLFEITGIEEPGNGKLCVYFNRTSVILEELEELSARHLSRVSFEDVKEKNWNEEWERSFKPLLIGSVSLRADFHEEPASGLLDIIVTPKMSFGTGHHATTEMMVRVMEDLDLEKKEVLDLGTGTGVLAIISKKRGAKTVVAVDNDEWSIRNSKENFEANQVEGIRLVQGTASELEDDLKVDVVLANINRSVLLGNMHFFTRVLNNEGLLLLSGIMEADVPLILESAGKKSLRAIRQESKGDWVAILFTNGK